MAAFIGVLICLIVGFFNPIWGIALFILFFGGDWWYHITKK